MNVPDAFGTSAPAAVAVRDLHVRVPARSKAYATPLEVLRGLTFTAPAGQVTALVGANGAGKSTALRAVTGALPFAEGTVEVLGSVMGPADVPFPTRAAHVPDDPSYPAQWTAQDVLRIRRRISSGIDSRAFDARLAARNVPTRRRCSELSRGQITQLGITAALAQDPHLLILDEPLARLDPLARSELLDELRSLMAREDRSVLLATHDLDEMDRIVDHLVVIADGKDILEGDVDSLCEEFLVIEMPEESSEIEAPGSPLIGSTTIGGTTRALIAVEDAAGMTPGAGLRRPSLGELVTHWLRGARTTKNDLGRRTA